VFGNAVLLPANEQGCLPAVVLSLSKDEGGLRPTAWRCIMSMTPWDGAQLLGSRASCYVLRPYFQPSSRTCGTSAEEARREVMGATYYTPDVKR
jgi:hypothetical protein